MLTINFLLPTREQFPIRVLAFPWLGPRYAIRHVANVVRLEFGATASWSNLPTVLTMFVSALS